MARPARLDLPGVPLHVIQRGNNRAACFFEPRDYRLYLDCLREAAKKYGTAIHAYVLMTNHVHLLVTPQDKHAVSRMMQWVGRSYVRTVNKRHERSGTLWDGRFRSAPIDNERHFLSCQRYVELNPVRAGLAQLPADYTWSSHRYYANGLQDLLITEHDCYRTLGTTISERRAAYLGFFATEVDTCTLEAIRASVNRGRPLGAEQFKARAKLISRSATVGPLPKELL